jgi:hypothetical protein
MQTFCSNSVVYGFFLKSDWLHQKSSRLFVANLHFEIYIYILKFDSIQYKALYINIYPKRVSN